MYKEIKATGGDVAGVLKDLKEQFHKLTSPSPAQVKQYNEEVKRVQEVAKASPADVLNDIWDQLGTFVDQYTLMAKAYVASEVDSKQVYRGDMSIGRRALERLKVRYQLDTMLTEMREQMVYHAPPELGDLWTRFEKMWMQIVADDDKALAEEMRKAQVIQWQRRRAWEETKAQAAWAGAVVFVVLWAMGIMWLVKTSTMLRLGLY